jgi:hypothetical protein
MSKKEDIIITLIEKYYSLKEDTEVKAFYDESGKLNVIFLDDVMQRVIPISVNEVQYMRDCMFKPLLETTNLHMHISNK